MDNYSEDNISDFQERIAPHELMEEDRSEYLRDLWKEFSQYATRGTVSLFDGKQIAEQLRVDGEETFLDNNTTADEKQTITYQRLVHLLDDMGKSSTEEYRDIEFDKAETGEGQQIVYLGPKDYLVYLCSGDSNKASGKNGTEDGSGANETSGATPHHQHHANVTYKLKFTDVEITPKRLLLASTGGLMLLICAAIIVGMALLWGSSANKQEEVSLAAFHEATRTLVEQMERNILEEHTKSLVDQAVVLARWSESRAREERDMDKHSHTVVTTRTSELLSFENSYLSASSDLRMRAEILRSLNSLGVAVPSGPYQAPANANRITTSECEPSMHYTEWGRHDLIYPTAAASGGSTWFCSNISTATKDTYALAGLTKAASTLEILSTKVELGGYLNVSFQFVLVDHGGSSSSILTFPDQCVNDDGEAQCDEVLAQLTLSNGTPTTEFEARGYNNVTYLFGSSALQRQIPGIAGTVARGTLMYGQPLKDSLDTFRQRTVAIVNHLNFNFVRSTEIVVSLWNETSDEVIPQATAFRFDYGCFFNCSRFSPSSVNIRAAFEYKLWGWSITPDYRPEPVVGAFSYVGEDLNMAIVFERDVIELRGISFARVMDVINTVNARNQDVSLELEMVGFKGADLMRQFYVYEPCPASTDCVVDPRGTEDVNGSYGIIFRYDCRHCQRVEKYNREELIMYQTPRKNYNPNVSTYYAPPSYAEHLLAETKNGLQANVVDYNDDNVFVAYTFLENYTTLLTAKVDRSEVVGPISSAIGISVGIGIATIIVGMAAVVILSHKAFDAIEAEWSAYKKQIEREQNKFAELVRGIIPPAVAERLMRGSKIISDNVLTVSFAFVDVCSFHEMTRHWSPKHVARYMTYCIAVMDEVAMTCEMTKLRSIGNLYICVGLREDKHRNDAVNHPACRAARFSSLLMILFSKAYSHRPQQMKALKDVFKDVLKDHTLDMPTLRIGVHCGPSISGAFTIGKTSHYDFFGISPSLANRMQQTAQPGRIHVTMMVKEMLKTRDVAKKYFFDASRKTVVRGQGTITSYFMRSIVEPVPQSVIVNLGMMLAVTRIDFTPVKSHNLDDSGSDTGSVRSAKSYRSSRSSRKSGRR